VCTHELSARIAFLHDLISYVESLIKESSRNIVRGVKHAMHSRYLSHLVFEGLVPYEVSRHRLISEGEKSQKWLIGYSRVIRIRE
jgi:hypothetical protein